MDKEEAYRKGFEDPSNPGLLYSKSKNSLVRDLSIEDKKRTRKKCEFWTKTEFDREFEERSDFSVSESESYFYEEPTTEPFTSREYRLINEISQSECSSCNGTGDYCSECNGTGSKSCNCFNGYKRNTCSNCNGSGKVEVIDSNLDERNIQCGDCDGSGRNKSVHSRCGGSGELDCKNCLNGNREISCEDCDGTGDVSMIDATVVKYKTSTNVSENIPSEVKNAGHYYISNASDSQWNSTHQKTFDEIPESGDGDEIPTDELLLPVPDGDNLKIRYEKEEIEYEKLNFTLDTNVLSGNYEEDTVETDAWKQKGRSRVVNKIDASRVGLLTYIGSVMYNFVVVGLWGGSIITLILMLPIAAINDYIFEIPDLIFGLTAFVIFCILNLIIMWDSVTNDRYRYKI